MKPVVKPGSRPENLANKPMKPVVKPENRHANLEFWLILTFFCFPIFDKNCANRFLNRNGFQNIECPLHIFFDEQLIDSVAS
jgi:hypothetical protein